MGTSSFSTFLVTVLMTGVTSFSSVSGQVPSVAPPIVTPPTGAPETGVKTSEVPRQGAHALTKEDVEAWLDGFIPYALQRGDIAGAVVAVVKDGHLVLGKGYGYADVAARKPVDPEKTLFRAGSISKLFTWTAVMQLVEQGKLDLDKDVNSYLDFKLPARGGKAITLRNLMTHTPGFDEVVRALIVNDPRYLVSLGDVLKHRVPPLVTVPGTTPAYSNYGAVLAGYIVQNVSGESFDNYIEQYIFQPLGMQYATFRQPVPSELQLFMSRGYKVASDDPKPFEILTIAPAGSISISGADMAHFMIAHLQNGAFGSNRILQEATAVRMHGTASTMIPPLNRMLLGFYENNINGRRVISHDGDTVWFHSELDLFVDDNVGLYLSLNSVGKDGAAYAIRPMLFKLFSDRYFPGAPEEGQVDAATARQHAQLIAGRYIVSRRSHTSFLALSNLLGQTKVMANSDGSIESPEFKGPEDELKKWREIAPFVWRNINGSDRLAAKVENGRVTRFGVDESPMTVFEPVPWWWSSAWLLPFLIISLVALALTALSWPISALVRRHYGVTYGLTGIDARAHRLARIGAVLVAAAVLAWIIFLQKLENDLDLVSPSSDSLIIFLRISSSIILIGGAAIALWNVRVVLHSQRRWLAKVWSVIFAIFCLCVLYVGVVFHLVGYSANY
jgi:CubicO group peptidase (beta-lactamase class C family)